VLVVQVREDLEIARVHAVTMILKVNAASGPSLLGTLPELVRTSEPPTCSGVEGEMPGQTKRYGSGSRRSSRRVTGADLGGAATDV